MNKKNVFKVVFCLLLVSLIFTSCRGNEGTTVEDPYASYPEKPIKLIVPYAPGGGSDTIARAIASSIDLGQPMVITNIEGSAGTIGIMECYNSEPDGYTLLCGQPDSLIGTYLAGVLDIDVALEMPTIATLVEDMNCLVVAYDSPLNNLDDLKAYAEANPGELNWAAVGSRGTSHQWSAEIWEALGGIKVNYIPFDSAAKARVAVLGGHADVQLCQLSEAKALVDGKEMRVLGLAAEERAPFLPDIPTFNEQGYDVVSGLHRGISCPPDTPPEIIAKLETALKEVYEDPEFISVAQDKLGFVPRFLTSEEITNIIKERRPVHERIFNEIINAQY